MGHSCSYCALSSNLSNKCHDHYLPFPFSESLPSPGPAKGPLAATSKGIVAVSRPDPAKGSLAATAKGTVVVPSPGPAKGPLVATAKCTVVFPSPGPAKGLLAAIAKGIVAVPVIVSASPTGASPNQLQPDNLGKSALLLALLFESGMSFVELFARHHDKSCLAETASLPHTAAPISLYSPVHRCHSQSFICPVDQSPTQHSSQERPPQGHQRAH
jgi:hypothetical protein